MKLSMKASVLGIVGGMALVSGQAMAHVGYGNSLYDQATNTYGSDNSSGFKPTVSSNAGWLSGLSDNGVNRTAAADTFGDSHNNRFRFFTLTQSSQVSLTVTGLANATVSGNSNPALNGLTPSTLNPGVSIFKGLVPAASHDGAGDTNGLSSAQISTMQTAEHKAYLASQPGFASWSPFYDANDEIVANSGASNPSERNKWGVFKSDGDFTMGNNNGLVSSVEFVDAKADMASGAYADGVVDNVVTWSGILGPGTYTITIGGASLSELTSLFAAVQTGVPSNAADCTSFGDSDCNGTTYGNDYAALRLARTMDIDLTVTAVPVPGSVWLFGSALMGFLGMKRRARNA